MSVLSNPVRHQPFAVSARLNRLLLFCRFDFRQKTWGFPASAIRRERDSHFSADVAHLASIISKNTDIFPGCQLFKPKEPRRGRRTFSATRVAKPATHF